VLNNAVFATEKLLVEAATLSPDWGWWDSAANTRLERTLAIDMGPARLVRVDGEDGRTLVVLTRPDEQRNTAVVAYPDGRQIATEISYGLATLVHGDALVYSPGKGRVFARVGDGEPHEVATLDGELIAIAPRGRLGYVALSQRGDLVRGTVDGGSFERTQLAGLDSDAVVATEPDGSVLIGWGNHLQRWGTAVEEIARLPQPVRWIRSAGTGIVIGLANDTLTFIPASGDRTPRPVGLRDGPNVTATDSRIYSLSASGDIAIVELPSLVEWTLPKLYSAPPRFAASPTGSRLYQVLGFEAVLWSLPEPGSDFGAWLDELTNATDVDRHVRWPW
jgi:hypothetical protein